MNTTTHIDYTTARERLTSITTDPAALASLELVAKSGEMEPEFCEVVARLNISLDYVFGYRGDPIMPGSGRNASVAHQRPAPGHGNDLAGGQDAVLKGH
jgi:hypothetical protein